MKKKLKLCAMLWVDPRVGPNAPAYGSSRTDAKREDKELGRIETEQRVKEPFHFTQDEKLKLKIWFYPPDKGRRDLDNLLGCMKPRIDGICEVLGINDSQFVSIHLERKDPRKGGLIDIEIST